MLKFWSWRRLFFVATTGTGSARKAKAYIAVAVVSLRLGRAQKQILRVWHYSMQQCRTLSPESLVSPVKKGMGHILGYFLLLEVMEISSPCAKALPFSWQRPIVMTVRLANPFNLIVDLCGRSFMFTFLSCTDPTDWLLSEFLSCITFYFCFSILYNHLFCKYFPECRSSWWQCKHNCK